MAGAYSHIMLAREASARSFLQARGVPREATVACGQWPGFCELGALGPDLGCLSPDDPTGRAWSDAVHGGAAAGVLRAAIAELRGGALRGRDLGKALAWLFGYCSHLVLDATLHPVIDRLSGEAGPDAATHRAAEMHQDLHSLRRLRLPVALADHLRSGLVATCDPGGRLEPAIAGLWARALQAAAPGAASEPPDPAAWHRTLAGLVEGIDGESGKPVPLARHVAPGRGLTYPDPPADPRFIESLPTPLGRAMHFDDLCLKAKGHLGDLYRAVAGGALGLDDGYESVLQPCDLDTGRDAGGTLVYWRAT